jgi:penicillin-binding protein 1A
MHINLKDLTLLMNKRKNIKPSPAYTMENKHDIGFANDKPKKKKRHLLKNSFIFLLIAFLTGSVFLLSYVFGLDEWRYFEPNTIKNMRQSIVLYDMQSNEIGSLYASTDRRYISLDQIPENIIDAFIATEDARFYEHSGVDVVRIFGAFLEDIKSLSFSQGASTISQQLVKNACLTSEKSISRKLQEAIMALKLERAYAKDEILEMYINYIYYGGGAYGIQAASKKYFAKDAKYLTLAESALLVGVVKAPGRYAPHLDAVKSKKRRDLVLSLMYEQGYITISQYNNALSSTVSLILDETSDFEFGYFTDIVLDEAEDILNLNTEEVLGGGYKIYTTLDTDLQSYAQNLYKNSGYFPEKSISGEICQSALIVLDTSNSAIRTCIGGREYTSKRCLNRATSMLRQPGSTIKPVLVYAPAVERYGYMPTSFVLDEIENFNGYTPKNFNNRTQGWVTLRYAVAKSLNIPAVRLLEEIGIDNAKLFASNSGINFEEDDNNLSLALGGFSKGISPVSLCSAYTPFANGGYYSDSYTISKIIAPDGTLIYEKQNSGYNILSEESAYLVSSMLSSTVEYGTAKALKMDDIPLSAKTGTTEFEGATGNRDAWILAYNKDYAVCCWMGFDETSLNQCLDNSVTGGSLPAMLAKDIFRKIYEDKAAPSFIKPKDVVSVNLDLKALNEDKMALLATAFTPKNQTTQEYFKRDSAPTQYTDFWSIPKAPSDLTVVPNNHGYPVISFSPEEQCVTYQVRRTNISDNTDVVLIEFEKGFSKAEYTDMSVINENIYLYYILPIHQELKEDGKAIEGPSSSAISFEYYIDELNETDIIDPAV